MKRLVCLAMLCTAVLAPRAAHAQDDAEARPASLSLRPFGDGAIGVWYRLSPRTELGLEVGGSRSHTETDGGGDEQDATTFTIEPAVKRFGASRNNLQPYAFGSLYFTSQKVDYTSSFETATTLFGTHLGLGLEWTPAARVRIGGHTGVRVAMQNGERTQFDAGGNPFVADVEGWEVGTFTSGLTFYYSF
ncbi:outer membrane beta-barrel protein [Longimicrobium sp.]|uniref:outer membrane beta-barrel protein n=1 Tax=Longimicrobium sp. TaxID=2029185 RepID=UPI003B3A40BF